MSIPIDNVYYLLCYAWGHVDEREVVRLDDLEGLNESHDLLGKLLAEGTFRLIRRGIDRDYREVREDLLGIRGKVVMSDTVARSLRSRGRVACDFEELSHDVLHSRILRSSLAAFLRVPGLHPSVRKRIRLAHRALADVSVVRLSRRLFGQVHLDRNRQEYRFLLSICRLAYDCLLVDETSGDARFVDFREDRHRMWELFEDFAIEFYRREQRRYRVNHGGRRIKWSDDGTSKHQRWMIPRMEGDVLLDSPERRIVLDTKYYSEALTGYRGARKLRADHLYQLLAYVRNREATTARGPQHEGILLYPLVGERISIDVRLEGYCIRARSIDLGQHWRGVHDDMLSFVDVPASIRDRHPWRTSREGAR